MHRSDLRDASGLSAAAVTNVVNDLLDDGLVVERADDGAGARRVGRPAATVSLAGEARHVVAVQIGAGTYQVGVCDLNGSLVASESATFPVREEADVVLADAADAVRRVIRRSGIDTDQLLGVGVGAAGVVDPTRRINLVSANAGWEDVPIADIFERELGIGTIIEHNVRAMAAAEVRYGLGAGYESLAFLYARTGLGLAFVFDGRPYRGGSMGSHEVGHIAVPGAEGRCSCGKTGCLETVVSDRAVLEELGDGLGTSAPGASWAEIWAAAILDGDAHAIEVRDRVVAALAPTIGTIVEMLNPQLIVLGGLLADAGPHIVDPLGDAVRERVTPWMRESVDIRATEFGPDSGLVGAGTIALDHFLFGAPIIQPRSRETVTTR